MLQRGDESEESNIDDDLIEEAQNVHENTEDELSERNGHERKLLKPEDKLIQGVPCPRGPGLG